MLPQDMVTWLKFELWNIPSWTYGTSTEFIKLDVCGRVVLSRHIYLLIQTQM